MTHVQIDIANVVGIVVCPRCFLSTGLSIYCHVGRWVYLQISSSLCAAKTKKLQKVELFVKHTYLQITHTYIHKYVCSSC